MMKKATYLAVLGGLMGFALPAQAVIININGVNNARNNPVVVPFDVGTYQVEPIGIADGGAYNATSYHYSWPDSWRHAYVIESSQFPQLYIDTGWQATEMTALANAISTSFTLASPGNVNFYIWDGPNGYEYRGDNVGGISLSVESPTVPAPGAVILGTFGAGLVGWLRRRGIV